MKNPETLRKYAAYFADFPYTPLVITAKNKTEATAAARAYRKAWKLPAMIRLDALTEEEAAKTESK